MQIWPYQGKMFLIYWLPNALVRPHNSIQIKWNWAYCPKNDENRKSDDKESYAYINGLFIGTVVCEPHDEEISEIMNKK